jgi:MFS transporter, ACS family, hexuronate transporter
VWGFALARMVADPVWYFYLFWFPKYLGEERGMTLIAIASLAWIVYFAADIGSITGGLFSGRLIKRGVEPVRSRLIGMSCAACLAPIGALIVLHPSIPVTLALCAIVAFAHLVFQVNMGSLIVDFYPPSALATIFGLIAAGSGLGGFLSTRLVGEIASSGSYDNAFLAMALLHPVACCIAWVGVRGRRAEGVSLSVPAAARANE